MRHNRLTAATVAATWLVAIFATHLAPASAQDADRSVKGRAELNGWLGWRGPYQNGTSGEAGLPDKWELGGANDLWSIDLAGRGTPVAVGDRVYVWGYRGEGDALVEVIACLDAKTGKTTWEHEHPDFLSDSVYDRYAIGSPTIDPQTGRVYLLTTPGLLLCYDADGKELWRHSMAEEFGLLTFPNARVGAAAIDGDLVIVNVISANWGAEGPPRNRFYAFDKMTGAPAWSSTPCIGPPAMKDNSFSTPIFATDGQGRRVFYAGLGSGSVACVNARTGEPIWRYQIAIGGINSSPVVHGDKVICVHGVQNTQGTKVGRMFAIDRNAKALAPEAIGGAPPLPAEAQLWHADIEMFSSSPVLVGDRVYQVSRVGELHCLNADTGKELWKKKLGTSQIHASPAYGDGKLYVPMNDGMFYILKPTDEGAEELSKTQLDGECLGAPCIWNGRVYVFTTKKLYAFGSADGTGQPAKRVAVWPEGAKPASAASLMVRPSELVLRPGERETLSLLAVDGRGFTVGPVTEATVAKFIPPTARVKSEIDATIEGLTVIAGDDASTSAGAIKATASSLPAPPAAADKPVAGVARGRVLPSPPFAEDFEGFELAEKAADGAAFAYPPLPWIGARFKWEVREVDGNKALAKTLDRLILSRAITFIGHPGDRDYTLSADVMTEGNRRIAGEVGVINQRYCIILKGSYDQIEVNSNLERLRVSAPFEIKPGQWYSLKTRVDIAEDGGGVVRAKAWARGSDEPEAWTIEVPVRHAHTEGAPGVFGFSPQNKPRVYVDNIRVEPNKND